MLSILMLSYISAFSFFWKLIIQTQTHILIYNICVVLKHSSKPYPYQGTPTAHWLHRREIVARRWSQLDAGNSPGRPSSVKAHSAASGGPKKGGRLYHPVEV